MKLTKRDLQVIFDTARDYYTDLSPSNGNLNSQEFVAKCYILACAKVLNLPNNLEFPVNKIVEPVED